LPEKFIRHDLTESIITENLAERKAEMLKRADAVVAFPGSIGTFDELFDALAQKKTWRNQLPHRCFEYRWLFRSAF
jgi:predicted Rossmann-fold nucleotide-binding protein